jgi:hypothetical protein
MNEASVKKAVSLSAARRRLDRSTDTVSQSIWVHKVLARTLSGGSGKSGSRNCP